MASKMLEYAEEKELVERIYGKSAYNIEESSSNTAYMRKLMIDTFRPYINKEAQALEFGCSGGVMTGMLSDLILNLDVVDGSETCIKEAKKNKFTNNVNFIHSLFEEYRPGIKYDYVFATFILEHVLNVSDALGVVTSLLKPDGFFFVVVPNANSLSRQLARHMGLISDLKDLTENDNRYGHRRVYDRVSLNRDLENNNFEVVAQGGLLLKLLADFQMDKLIDDGILTSKHIEGLYRLGLEYPDFSGALYSICKVRK